MNDADLERETYIDEVLRWIPTDVEDRDEIAMEIRSVIAERVAAGEGIGSVLHELGTPLEIAESYLEDLPVESAFLGRRFVAKVIDFVIFFSLLMAVVLVFLAGGGVAMLISGSFVNTDGGTVGKVILTVAIMFATASLALAYPILTEWRYGMTIGKAILGLRVIRESGARISFGQAVVRQIPMLLQVIWFDALFIFFNPRRQRATEMLSHTRVISAR